MITQVVQKKHRFLYDQLLAFVEGTWEVDPGEGGFALSGDHCGSCSFPTTIPGNLNNALRKVTPLVEVRKAHEENRNGKLNQKVDNKVNLPSFL